MANTYSQVNLHVVFAIKNRNSAIPAIYLPRVHAYIGGILKQHGHFPYAIGGTENHVHIMLAYNLNQPIPDMVRDVKSSSSKYINEQHLISYRFEWQAGYGCFSYSQSQIDKVCNYIRHQFEHHKSVSLEDEIRSMLEKFRIEYDPRYVLREPEA